MNLSVTNFSLHHTLSSGQFFSYQKIGPWYYCNERDKLFTIRQVGNTMFFSGTTEEHIKKLFGLTDNYDKHISHLLKDDTLKPAMQKYRGLRVMQRDPWETLVSFQCSIMSNIKKITLNMNRLAQHFGKPISKNTILSYTFPAPGTLNNLQTIQNCATGFRAKYIHAANSLVDDSYFEKLRKKTYENAHEKLMELPGVGDKVADCICLFALGKTEAFPVDVWISRIMSNTYFDGKPIKNQLLKQFAKDRWGKNAGLAQQFLYHWGRNGK